MLATVLLLAYLSIARATHTVCSWKAWEGHPADQGYTLFCTGELQKEAGDDAHARYWCKELSGVMVADFGYLKPETLEWGEWPKFFNQSELPDTVAVWMLARVVANV